MKYIKMLGLLAVTAAAVMVHVGTASATSTEAHNDPVEINDVFHAEAEGTVSTHGSIDVACAKSTLSGGFSANGGTSIRVSHLTFTECNKDTVTPFKGGSLSINSANEIFSTGAEIVIRLHRIVLGFPVTTHCIITTNNTKIGTLISEGANATMSISSALLKAETTDGACGSFLEWTGNYAITTPAYFAVD